MNDQNANDSWFKLGVAVFSTACSIVLLEILLSRMYVFFLGSVNTYLAIPVTMLGLSLGCLLLHVRKEPFTLDELPKLILIYVMYLITALLLFFSLFNYVFDLTNWYFQSIQEDVVKVLSMTLIFIPPFAMGGVILSIIFRHHASSVGRLYAYDLCGSASACVIGVLVVHYFGLPLSLAIVIALASVAFFFLSKRIFSLANIALLVFNLLIVSLAHHQLIFKENFDSMALAGPWSYGNRQTAEEVYSRWDELSRVSLVDFGLGDYKIIHDDGVSLVHVDRYEPGLKPNETSFTAMSKVPFLLNDPPKKILVIFAGAGKDMIALHSYAPESSAITGVEISPIVEEILSLPELSDFRIKEFFDKKNITYIVDEGRSFLERTNEKFDLIFLGTNGATFSNRFGSTRKYLDTYEAQELMLSKLSENGSVMFFMNYFFDEKLEIYKDLMSSYSSLPFENTFLRFGWHKQPTTRDSFLFRPSGYSQDEITKIDLYLTGQLNQYFFHPVAGDPFGQEKYARDPLNSAMSMPSDGRPYYKKVNFSSFFQSVPPDAKSTRSDKIEAATEWAIIFSFLTYSLISLLVVVLFLLTKKKESFPKLLFIYFIITGIAYMLVQISLMSRLELFLGKPLYSISTVLGSFLFFNGIGAWLFDFLKTRQLLPRVFLPLLLVLMPIVIYLTYEATSYLMFFIGLDVIWRIFLTTLCLIPISICLGFFYPYGVDHLQKINKKSLVPMSFGFSTVSSVFGGVFSIVFAINIGYQQLVYLAAGLYLILFLIVFFMRFRPKISVHF